MTHIEHAIEVDVPIHTAYEMWSRFEDFPQFMEGVRSVRPLDDVHLRWKAAIAGRVFEWIAEIYALVPDRRIAWCSVEGPIRAGSVSFEALDAMRTRVRLAIDCHAASVAEKPTDPLDLVSVRVRHDLQRWKAHAEDRGGAPEGRRSEFLAAGSRGASEWRAGDPLPA